MEAIYLEDSYVKEFDAVVDGIEDGPKGGVFLDRTAFYPASGGQPSDLGILFADDERYAVIGASFEGGRILHLLDKVGLVTGDNVHGTIDWDRRYPLMRSHTACHMLSAVIFQETGAKITGNQIDISRSRVDFSLEQFDRSMMGEYVERANEIMEEDRPVNTRIISREEAATIPELVRLAMDVADRDLVRIVEIEGTDLQACGGTHVRRTGEVGRIKLVKAENKGKANRRVYFALED